MPFRDRKCLATAGPEHDLESFLYVLLWTCCGEALAIPEWHTGTPSAIATMRTGQMMQPHSFEELLGCFHPGFVGMKPLARQWRKILSRHKYTTTPRVRSSGGADADSSDDSDSTGDYEVYPMYVVLPWKANCVTRSSTDWHAFVVMRDALCWGFKI